MRTRITKVWLTAVLGMLIAASSAGAVAEEADLNAVTEAVRPACVHVEYTLRYANGEAPTCSGWRERCPNCGAYHGLGGGEEYVEQKRPKIVGGYLLSPTLVLTGDPQMHPRFIEKIAVRCGEQLVSTTPAAYPTAQNGLLLKLDEPLSKARPLAFDAQASGPYYAVSYRSTEAQWTIYVEPLSDKLVARDDGSWWRPAPAESVIVNQAGLPVGATMNAELPADDSWKGAPLEWPALSAAEMATSLKKIEEIARAGLLPVTLKFRSPKRDKMDEWRYSYGEQDVDTEQRAAGMLVNAKTLLIPANLKPTDTARLERIQIALPDGQTAAARFGCSLRELGCFTAELESPLDGALVFDTRDILTLRNELAFAVEYRIFGDSHVLRVLHARVPSFERGHKGWVYPDLPGSDACSFLFRADGTLSAAQAIVRSIQEDQWSLNEPLLTPISVIAELLVDPTANADAGNAPLPVDRENRVAWLGIEMQSLDAELARMNNVSEYTQNGQTGVIVSYVYPDSPADRAGVATGDILLRLHLEDRPKPLTVTAEESHTYMSNFPWDRLDDCPEEFFDQIPQPWPPVENNLTRTLTQAGFGKKLLAEFFTNGAIVMKEFEIFESPPHYESAPRYKSDALGITVRNLTYEVRRYFQRKHDEPGIIVSKVEQGSKASVAGVRPFEIITHLNDQPVVNVGEFESLLKSTTGELRLNVKRMAQGRIVKIKLPEVEGV